MMAELNPQLNRDLKIIASSPETIPSITCIRQDYDPAFKDTIIDALGKLLEEPRGQQILMLFKIDGLVPFKELYLESPKELLVRHAALRRGLEKEANPKR